MTELVTLPEIEAAARLLDGVIRPTPTVMSDSLSNRLNRPVWLKHEQQQRTGSFKFRGAYNMLSDLPAGTHVVAASAGNHAQGVALAARLLGMKATIFMPVTVSLPKLEATESYGAEIELVGSLVDECLTSAAVFAHQEGAVLVPPFDDRRIIAGAGTIGLEVMDAVVDLECVLTPIGGGGLCSGVSAAVKLSRPDVTTVGVMAEGASSMQRSIDVGEPVTVVPRTMADGIAIGAPAALTLNHILAFVDQTVSVGDGAIATAVLLAAERTKSILEPAGAASLAAALEGLAPGDGAVAVVLSGGNMDPLLLGRILEYGLTASGRFLRLWISLGDLPGALSDLTRTVADMGVNIVSVEHHRRGTHLPVGQVEVELTLETRNESHQREIIDHLSEAGFEVGHED